MYIQITTRCNMKCRHCCFACEASGTDMSPDVFGACLDYCGDNCEIISIGGGEPTIHPMFWDYLCKSIGVAVDIDFPVWIATNGKIAESAITLAKMAESGTISCALSVDKYHEKIEEKVLVAFKKKSSSINDYREIRDIGNILPVKSGRCDWGQKESCPCEDLFVNPKGDIFACGCENSMYFGNILGEFEIPEGYEHCCSNSNERVFA